ncbi:N-acetylglucosamine kinase [Metarhizobium album]|uniref:N-acetylglucosamine kinase n=1 Tax=Metarhizobium album TaxID=2182425 RepID=A0A2U2DJT1_9HYPH|nr:ROK family protein [Rhizobium album]PWE53511.1 N-acetylglucosamine kinase [Rhizobium album]
MILCFDIGGTAIKGAVAHSPTDVRTLPRVPTPAQDFDAFVGVLARTLAEIGEKPHGIAISIAGVIDPETRAAKVANIPCIDGRLLAADLQAALGLPVLIANDADCLAVAEAGVGAGRGHRIVFGAILGTGVGGGLVVDGRLVNAEGGFAGEWGHGPAIAAYAGTPPVAIPPFACGCGQRGCVDTVGGARGLERLHRLVHDKDLDSERIVADWLAGDAEAARTVGVLIDLVSSPLALTINITGATIVPVGGGLSNCEQLLAEIDRTVRSRTLRRFDRPLVVRGTCRVEPGLIGAAILGLKEFGHA